MMESSTELQRNPPLPKSGGGKNGRGGPLQVTLEVLINGATPSCDCIYISQAAVDAHHLPTPAGWYVEVPDDDVPFTVRFSIIATNGHKRLSAEILVDGQHASCWTVRPKGVHTVQGVNVGTDAAERELIQPFLLKKATFEDAARAEDDDEEDHDDDEEEHISAREKRAVGTIVLQISDARKCPTLPDLGQASYTSFVERGVVSDKKASFAGTTLKTLEVRYRTAKFFHALQCRISPPGTHKLTLVHIEEVSATTATTTATLVNLDGEGDEEDEEGRERKSKRIKCEPIATGARAVRLDTAASVDTFLTRLAEKEEMEMSAFKLLLLELSRRSLTTVGHLRQLTRDQWREIMRASVLPVSLARSASQLLSSTSSSSSSSSVCIVLDD